MIVLLLLLSEGSLAVLSLSGCGLNAAALLHLSDALAGGGGARLRALLLSHNRSMGDAGVAVLCLCLEQRACPELRQLHLRGVGMADRGVAALTRMVQAQCCPRLAQLYLRDNYVSHAAFHRLQTACLGAL